MEKLVQEDLGLMEVVQEDMCEKEGFIQEEQAPAADSSPSRQHRETRRTGNRLGATMRQEEVKIGRRHCSLLLEDSHKMEADCNFRNKYSSCHVMAMYNDVTANVHVTITVKVILKLMMTLMASGNDGD